MIDLHFVAPALAVGARLPPEAAPWLASELRIARVVDLRVEACDDEAALRRHGIRLLHLPTEDACAISPVGIREGVTFVSEGLDRGERTLIHCQYGIGRSALLAVCVLVARGEPPLAAMERVKRARPAISPSPAQLEALAAYYTAIVAERGAPRHAPSVEELGAIAWRHLRENVSLDEARAASSRSPHSPFRDGDRPAAPRGRC